MFLFENTECPVCKTRFEEGDDVVVCPDCGTPHHRACYSLTGKCVNSGLHETGFNFRREKEKERKQSPVFVPVPEENREGTEGEKVAQELFESLTSDYANSSDTIDGKSVSDIAATVNTNIPRFMARFRKMEGKSGRAGWNWGAFFFGSLYFFYRKMYRSAISLISLVTALIFASDLAITKLAPKAVEALQEAAALASGGDAQAFSNKLLELQDTSDFRKAVIISYALFGIILIIRIIEAVFADYMYKKNVFSLIESTDISVDDGAVFQSPFVSINEIDLNESQMRKLYLARKGGVSIFAPFAAFMAVYILISFI